MLAFKNLGARYGALEALKDVSISFDDEERVAIFGHNGAGKTTLLRCGVGAHAHVSGTVTYRGEPIRVGEVHRNAGLGIGFVPQGHNVFADLNVEQNLRIAGLMHDPSFARRVCEIFPVLAARRLQRAGSMSGGEQQMLALGMALMTRPGVLLLDEPTTGLAPVVVNHVLDALERINEEMSTTIVIVEQNVPATLKVVDRAVVLKMGRVVFDGPSRELSGHKDLWAWF